MLKSSLWDYSDAYILVKGTITVVGRGDHVTARKTDERNIVLLFKRCAPFTDYIREINIT